jgi:hypothetical protein
MRGYSSIPDRGSRKRNRARQRAMMLPPAYTSLIAGRNGVLATYEAV